MELMYCREFITLAQTRNYVEAAEKLYISQSTLSRHIQLLERELGAQLFSRSTRRVELTDFGLVYYNYARRVIEIENEFNDRVSLVGKESGNEVNICLCHIASWLGITKFLHQLRKKYPELTINATMAETHSSKLSCLNGAVDLIISREYGKERDERFERCLFYEDQIMLVVSPEHPFAEREYVVPKDVINENIISTGTAYGPYKHLVSACHNAGFEPVLKYTYPNISMIIDLVSLNEGVTVLAESLYRCLPEHCFLKAIPFKEPLKVNINILFQKGKILSPAVRLVYEAFVDEAERRSIIT